MDLQTSLSASSPCIVYSSLQPGGIPSKIIDISNEMSKTQPDTSITIILYKGTQNDLRSLITNKNVRILDYPYIKNPVLFMLWFWKQMLTLRPSSVLSFISPYSLPVLFIKKLLFPDMNVVVSEDHYTTTMVREMAFPRLQLLGIKYLYPMASSIIVPTKAIKKQLSILSPGAEPLITIIPNWTHIQPYSQITNKTIDLVHIGRLVRSKHPMTIVKWMHGYCKTKNNNATCLIMGDGPEYQKIANYIKINNLSVCIEQLHASQDISSLLRKSKIFLFAPEKNTEGFPVVLLEAMASGAVVITKWFDGIDEVINNNQNGFIVSNDKAVLTQIKNVLNRKQLMKSVLSNAKITIKTKHSLDNVSSYINVLI